MKITSVETIPVQVPINQERAIRSGRGLHRESPFVLVKVHTDEGLIGIGEVSCTPIWSGEDQVTAVRCIEVYLAPVLVNQDPTAIERLTARMNRVLAGNPFTKAGVEIALWDLLGKVANLPLYQLLGGPVRDAVPTKFSVSGLEPERAAEIAAWAVEQGFRTIKVKVGIEPEHDIARVRAVRAAIGPDVRLGKVLIISVHSEYWTRHMFERVRAWVDSGGRLLALSGNSINCEVELPTPDTMRCMTQLHGEGGALGMYDPVDPGRYYESRFHRTVAPEASLLGVVTTETGIMTGAPYKALRAEHWVFAGTGLRDGDSFGAASLHEHCSGGASGHETDKLSPHAPPGATVLAKGLNPDDGGAEIIYHERPDGGAVFSVGSITYVASLLVDETVSRITLNVLNRFLKI